MGHGSAAHRRRGAAPRPGHESPKSSGIAIHVIRAVSHSRGLCGPSFAAFFAPKMPRAQGRPGAGWHPRSTVRRLRYERLHSGITGEAQHTAFPAQWFYGLCRDLPGERCTIAPVALRMADAAARSARTHHRKTWRTDPGRQDHTILPYAGCTGRVRDTFAHGCPPCEAFAPVWPTSTTSHPAFVTIAIRPSAGLGWLFI
ncbi:hypothetical protein ACVWXM_008342 [Bradyrhizobium sp. GM7.3]